MYSNLGESARLRGDHAAAVGLYPEALAIAREIGPRESELIYLANLGGPLLGLRQFEAAEAELRRALESGSEPIFGALSETCGLLSEALLRQGKFEEALSLARQAVTLAQQTENDLDLGGAWRSLGLVQAALERCSIPSGQGGRLLEAAACFSESLQVFEKVGASGEQGRALRAWAECELQRGRLVEARSKLTAARRLFEQLGAASELAATDALWASIQA